MTGMARFSRGSAITTALLLLHAFRGVEAQTRSVCEGELGEANWACDTLAPLPSQVFDGQDELLPLPGSPDAANPVLYKQISGEPVTFDTVTGERNADGGTAVFALTEGVYWCLLAESNGEAALFDAPEGSFVSSTSEFPTATWLSESIEAILAPGTKLKYILYTHSHWDHIGTAGLVYEHFAGDNPTIITSKRIRAKIKARDDRGDPTSIHGNNRGVPIPEKLDEADYRELQVGGLRFEVQKLHAHERGDLVVFLDKNLPENAAEGIDTSVFFVVDVIFPGWVPFFSVALSSEIGGYYDAMDEILSYDMDVLVGGHLSRMGTKADVQLNKDFYDDVLEGARTGVTTVSVADVISGTGVFDPSNPNAGNLWLINNELIDRHVDVCETYVLDSVSRGRDWLAEMGGLDVTLRSQCWAVAAYVRIG